MPTLVGGDFIVTYRFRDSEIFHSISHDEETNKLTVTFKEDENRDKIVKTFHGVDESIFNDFSNSDDPYDYFKKEIESKYKKSKFKTTRLGKG